MIVDIGEEISRRIAHRDGLRREKGRSVDPDRRWDISDDPGAGVDRMPPNVGKFLLPHVGTFAGMVSSQARVYRPSDEALRNSEENARFMRNDPVIMECVEMRQRLAALLDWHIEPENPQDPKQVEIADQITKIIQRIPRFMQYRECLLNAVWFGRYAVVHKWQWKRIDGKMRLTIGQWKPLHGDKLVWRYDDHRGRHRSDQLGIRIGPAMYNSSEYATFKEQYRDRIEATDWGLAFFLDSWQENLISVHKHFIEDGEWEDPFSAGAIHGRGLRSRLYWTWFQKQESLAFLMEFLERSAAGFEIWSYPMHNPQAREEVRKAATDRSELGRNVLLVPRPVGDEGMNYDVQRIEPGMAGAAELKSIITDYYGHQIKRYILGQTLTTEADATGLGSGLADIHLETLMGIVRYDSTNLEETITDDVVEPIKRYNFPEAADIYFAFRVDTEQPDSQAKMEAFNNAYNMGLTLRGQDVRDLIGAAKPEQDDEVLSMIEVQKKLMEMQAENQQPEAEPPTENDSAGEELPTTKMSAVTKPVNGQPEHQGVLPGGGDREILVPADGDRVERFSRSGGSLSRRAIY